MRGWDGWRTLTAARLRVWFWCLLCQCMNVTAGSFPQGYLSLVFCSSGCFLIHLSPGLHIPMGSKDCSGPGSPQIQKQAAKNPLRVLHICNVFPHISTLIFALFPPQRSNLRAERVILKILLMIAVVLWPRAVVIWPLQISFDSFPSRFIFSKILQMRSSSQSQVIKSSNSFSPLFLLFAKDKSVGITKHYFLFQPFHIFFII